MKHEGMVHALEEIRRLLKLDGKLVNILPIKGGDFIEVHQGGATLFAQREGETSSEDISRAELAVESALDREVFVIEETGEFDFLTYGSSVSELLTYWEEQNAYEDGHKVEEVIAQDQELWAEVEKIIEELGEGAEVAIHERVRIARLRPAK
jgi:signal transduction histidine kinase